MPFIQKELLREIMKRSRLRKTLKKNKTHEFH